MKTTMPMLALLACVTFFEYGCTAVQREAIVKEAVESAKTHFIEKILPEWKEKAADYAIAGGHGVGYLYKAGELIRKYEDHHRMKEDLLEMIERENPVSPPDP